MTRPTEKQFQAGVIKLARSCKWQVYHTYDSRRSQAGFPDLVLVRDVCLFRELKTNSGKVSAAQKQWIETLAAAGCDVAIWRPDDWPTIIDTLTQRRRSRDTTDPDASSVASPR